MPSRIDELGLDATKLVALRLAPGRFGIRVVLHSWGVEKAHQLAQRGVRPPRDIVYSDSLEDLSILAAARSGCA